MNCPKCNTVNLQKSGFGLPLTCSQCGGKWISHDEISKLSEMFIATDDQPGIVDDGSNDGKTGLCPNGHGIMLRAKVDTHDDLFYLEKCTKCGGIWFDKGELKRMNESRLIENIADFWTVNWQRKHRREKDREGYLAMNKKLFGDDIYDSILRLASLLKKHPEKTRALALLKEEMLSTHT